jgi:outer membrane lipoprotein-sorting protein
MVMARGVTGLVTLLLAVSCVGAQTTAPATQPQRVPQMDPLAESTLQMLHDRRDTLKDFQAKVVYDVYHGRSDDHEGKLGRVDFLMDPVNGPEFSVHFTEDTAEEKPVKRHEQDLVFDGRNLTVIDRRAMQYHRQDVLGAGAKPGDAVTLNGPVPLPIGISPEDVAKNFEVSVEPSTDAKTMVLKLVPRAEVKGNFEFKQLELTVDKALQLPVKIVRTDKKGDVTTVEFKEPAINTGKATMIDTTPPKEAGWDIDVK